MLKMKLFQKEKYNVDDMKLKKINSFVIVKNDNKQNEVII